ncbi:MAG: 4Fe-4S dicluster domain-containing protein [Deltaproteobacteria bacterium]|nr:4Fe-4S dicluster domain-containing protein [Deltaproteobacteria bacterium]MBW1930356.1 4Fe-4S dicluster domain-containing protein [Deltaproteobacteria bacterium]MBW2025198.1 4Fe-4S dicluster domain-containing protein [Deltaproteobacteria bacterium]MBW2125182.1 4Fe-4S dicluster domain-containing protein [Deltaproteobacteria bacterium]
MLEYTEKIRETAKKLLESGKVEVFIGYKKGSVPMMNEPVLIRSPEETDVLHWDSHCALNLCNYLTKRKEKIGIVATGCNSRNIVIHIIENQISRDQLYIVGVPCKGMVDHRAVKRAVNHREILEVTEEGDTIVVKGRDFEEKLEKNKVLQSNCAVCRHRNPVIYDELVAELVEEQKDVEPYKDVAMIEEMDPDRKWGFFTRMISTCIRCYACRNACPLCYCPTCFVDESRPQWVGKSIDPTDTMTFHLLRAYHCAGRCTDCGACERVCPVGISVRQFTKKLNKDAEELFDWEAGLSLDQRPPLDVYRPDDYNDFIR